MPSLDCAQSPAYLLNTRVGACMFVWRPYCSKGMQNDMPSTVYRQGAAHLMKLILGSDAPESCCWETGYFRLKDSTSALVQHVLLNTLIGSLVRCFECKCDGSAGLPLVATGLT
jgi:hypothetical protein